MRVCMISFGPIESKSNGYFIRSYYIAQSLRKLGNEIFVIEFQEEKLQKTITYEQGITFLHLGSKDIHKSRFSQALEKTLTFDPLAIIKFQLNSLIELFRFRYYLKGSDLVFVEGALIPFGILLSKTFKKKVVLDTHCLNKLLALHLKNRKYLAYIFRKILWDLIERVTSRKSNLVIVVSSQEKKFVHREYKIPKSKIVVIPNVIEIQKRNYSKKELTNIKKKWNLEDKIVVTFVGNLASIQNRDAVEYILKTLSPIFWKKNKNIIFLIIGKGKSDFKNILPNVVFTGFVEDISLYLTLSDVCIAPLRIGAGVKTKVLEYMVHEKPIVCTPIGAEGIELTGTAPSIIVTKINTFPEKIWETIINLDTHQRVDLVNIVDKRFSKKNMLKKLNNLLKTVKIEEKY